MTQRETARTLQVGLATLRNWEAGRTTVSEACRPRVVGFLGYDPTPAPCSWPERLRAARLAIGLDQKALALRLGLDPSTVRAWEAGRGSTGHSRVRQALHEFALEVERRSTERGEGEQGE